MIPEAAIEAAARAMFPKVWGPQVWTFRAHGEAPTDARNRVQQEALKQARAALEAAAPHIRAKALTDAAESWQVRMDTTGRGSADAKLFMQQRAAIERVAK